ncbi:hypothetical protein [Crassaminicella indica]|uniref:Uncharacterized protein n=1 Tax=Crassaminicella indica TaxID=2855394 RepID=A0ABX8RBL7_9CLOT|nr:hypothetical protein [Crassaminicella indica]QXM06454.1 hypothetical protein KVH43_01385 [Crassaminicella indica]
MKKAHKAIIYIILCVIIYVIGGYYGQMVINGYCGLKDRMYNDFEAFGVELENFNDELSNILVLKEHRFNKEKVFINKNIVWNFHLSNCDARSIGKVRYHGDYECDWMYYDVNDVIQNILYDGKITPSEEKYLKNLYDYTDHLIKEYRIIVKDVRSKWDYENKKKLKKRIVDIYNDYSKNAQDLLESKQYSFLKIYKGDFKDLDVEKAKGYCKEVFSKIVPDQTLKYQEEDDMIQEEYIFKTYEEGNSYKDTFAVKKDKPDVDYYVTYNKKTNKIVIIATGWRVSTTKKYTQDELDQIAKNIMMKFNKEPYCCKKKGKYDEKGNLVYMKYSYMEKNNDVYDAMKAINIELKADGRLSEFEIIYPRERKFILPTITKEEILGKINQEATIKDCIIRRNNKGEAEYVVYLIYKDTLYEAVFNGEYGNLMSYVRDKKNDYLK